MLLKKTVIISLLISLCGVLTVWAADGRVYIEANRAIYNKRKSEFFAYGSCLIRNGIYTIKSDRIYFNRSTYLAKFWGHILIEDNKGNWVKGSYAQINLNTYKGFINNALMFVKSNGMYIKAKKAIMLSKTRFAVEDAILTSCGCPGCTGLKGSPDWSVTAKHTKIVTDRYLIAYPVVFRIKRLPVFFSPVIERNLSKKRKTGFLSPSFGYSTIKGVKYEQPFFINISPSQDVTLSPFLYTKLGYGISALYRFYWTANSMGNWRVTLFKEKHPYNGEKKRIRVYINSWQYATFTDRLSAFYSLNLVNDRNNLRVINRDSISLASDRYTKSTARLTYTTPAYSFGIYGYYYQDLISQNNRGTLQKLPQIEFNLTNRKLYKNLTLDLSEVATNNFRIEGPRGYSNDLTGFLSYPFKISAINFVPSVGVHELYAYWKIAPYKKHFSRRSFIPEYDLNIKTSLFKIFWLTPGGLAFKHIITPSLSYQYIPQRDQSKFPDFVSTYPKTDMVTLSLENRIIMRRKVNSSLSYREILYFKLSQAYDFTKSTGTPFPPLYTEIRFKPFEWLSLSSKSNFSTKYGVFMYSDETVAANFLKEGASISYLMTRNPIDRKRVTENMKYKLFFYPSNSLYTYVEAERNILNHYFTRKQMGFMYTANCWSIGMDIYQKQIPEENADGTYTRRKDTGFWITLTLKGLLRIKKAY